MGLLRDIINLFKETEAQKARRLELRRIREEERERERGRIQAQNEQEIRIRRQQALKDWGRGFSKNIREDIPRTQKFIRGGGLDVRKEWKKFKPRMQDV